MQVNATIIAAQQAAREARAALQPKPATPQPAASFLAELDASAPASPSAEAKVPPAPIRTQTVSSPAPMRPGSLLDIKI